jgi:hypothetical protein
VILGVLSKLAAHLDLTHAHLLLLVVIAYTKCRFENARPEPVLRYCSNAAALSTLTNVVNATSDHGRR